MGFLELFILHCGLPEGVHIALLVSRKCIMVYILHSNNIVTGYKLNIHDLQNVIHINCPVVLNIVYSTLCIPMEKLAYTDFRF